MDLFGQINSYTVFLPTDFSSNLFAVFYVRIVSIYTYIIYVCIMYLNIACRNEIVFTVRLKRTSFLEISFLIGFKLNIY